MDAEGLNPFQGAQPFIGYVSELLEVTSGFRNGKSFLVAGGERCGKAAFLAQVNEQVGRGGVTGLEAFPRLIDLRARVPRSTFEFFALLYREIVRDCPKVKPWKQAPASQPYQVFLDRLQDAVPELEKRHGRDWLAVLLIDKLDLAKGAGRLELDNAEHTEVFYNLRNLFDSSQFKRQLRLVASGGSDMYKLTRQGSPLANILEAVWLRRFTEEEAEELLSAGPEWMREFRDELFVLSGRHPALLRELAARLWEAGPGASLTAVEKRCRQDLGGLFGRWKEMLGRQRCAVYQAIVDSEGQATAAELRRRAGVEEIDEPLRMLSFHGLIDDSGSRSAFAGTMFRDWFRLNAWVSAPASTPQAPDVDGPVRAIYSRMLGDATVHGKGRALEELVAAIFAAIPGFEVIKRNVTTETEEIDVAVWNNGTDSKWSRESELILIECKNWHSQKVGKNEFVIFRQKLLNRAGRARLGFLVCTGTFAETAELEKLRMSQDMTLVVLIDGAGLQKLVESRDRGAVLREMVTGAAMT